MELCRRGGCGRGGCGGGGGEDADVGGEAGDGRLEPGLSVQALSVLRVDGLEGGREL